MKKTSIIAMTGAAFGFLLLTGCGGAMVDEDAPGFGAYEYRHSLMHLAANRMALIGGMAREEVPLDEPKFVEATAQLAMLAKMNLDGFEMDPGEIVPMSRALPEIWQNMDDFEQKNQEFVDATQGLADAAAANGFAAAQGLVQGTASTCGSCHRAYRMREE